MENNNINMQSESTGSTSQTIVEQEPTVINTETEQILTFVDDKVENDFSIPGKIDVISDSENQGLESREHTIRDFLSRPIQIGEFSWDSTMTRNTQIFSLNLPSDLLKVPMIAEKIAGLTYLKGDVKVRLQINRQGFQAGIMQLRTFPVVSPESSYNTQLSTMKQFSALPGLDVNLESEKVIVLDVPYVYPTDVYDMIVNPDDWATVYGRVYSPLTAASATSVTVSVFCWFEKETLRLSMPTSSVSQSTAKVLSNFYSEKLMELQVGGEHVNASKAGGPVSKVTGAVSKIAKVASAIPGLSSVTAPIAVVSDLIGNVAGMFGFSKPTSDQIPTQVRNIYARGIANADFPDSSTQTALLSNNTLQENNALYRTDVDEMSFANMIRIPQFTTAFNYSTSNARGDLLFSAVLNPALLTSEINNTVTPKQITTTGLGIISSMFELWRGSINMTFKFCKTSFHSGRIMFVWFNVDANTFTVPNKYDQNFAKNYQYMLDLKDKYELDLNIPFLQANDWLNIHQVDSSFKNNNGVLAAYVINTLQAAPSASNTVECLVEVRAGSDMRFAEPKVPELLGCWINPIATYNLPNTMNALAKRFEPETIGNPAKGIQHFSIPTSLTSTEDFTLEFLTPNIDTQHHMDYVYPPNTVITYNGNEYISPGGQFLIFQTVSVTDVEDSGWDIKYHVYTQTNPSFFNELITTRVFNDDTGPRFAPIFSITFPSSFEREMELQIGRDDAIHGIDGESIAPAINLQECYNITANTVGEVVESSRLLLKRYVRDTNYIQNMQYGKTFIVINPNSFASHNSSAATYLSIFSACFRFFRGSMRYKLNLTYSGQDLDYTSTLNYYLLNNTTSDALPYDPALYCNSANIYALSQEVLAEFSVPYYNRNRITITGDVTSSRLLSPMQRRIAFDCGVGTLFNVDLKRIIGEDFSFGFWLGAPTLYATPR